MKKNLKVLAAAGVAALALTGCAKAGTAVTVNGQAVSENQVDDLYFGIVDSGGTVSSRGVAMQILTLTTMYADPISDFREQNMVDEPTLLASCQGGYTFVGTANVPQAVSDFCLLQYAVNVDPEFAAKLNQDYANVTVEYSKRYGELVNGEITLPEYLESSRQVQ